ncbi:MAG: arginase family protein [Promethearchaeota archaeon]
MVKTNCFLDLPSEIDENTEFIIIGIPIDGEMTQQRGKCVTAPEVVRKISLDLSLTSEDGTDLNTLHMVDLNDVSKDTTIEKLTQKISQLLNKVPQAIPIFIGGSHIVSNHTVQALLSRKEIQNLHYISLDAHLDCYDNWKGNKNTHCTVTRRIYETLESKPNQVYVIGARDIDLPELEWVKHVGFNFLRMIDIVENPDMKLEAIFSERNGIKPPVYLSVDIDVFDPSVAPATGYAIPGGISYRDYLLILNNIAKHFTIVGVDFVEYSPELDLPNKMTAFLIAKLIIETVNMIKKNR